MDELWIAEGAHKRAAEYAECLSCKKVFLRRKMTSKKSKQVFCSVACRFFKTSRVSISCTLCGKTFSRPVSKTKKRKNYCSKECKDEACRKRRVCLFCGLDTRRKNGRTGKFCNGKCMSEYRYKEYIAKWLSGQVDGNYHGSYDVQVAAPVRRYMMELSGCKCSKCGWSEVNQSTGKIPLHINHIDGNSNNTRKENLEVLCPNCHSLTPTFGILNRGKGRSKRRERRRKEKLLYDDAPKGAVAPRLMASGLASAPVSQQITGGDVPGPAPGWTRSSAVRMLDCRSSDGGSTPLGSAILDLGPNAA